MRVPKKDKAEWKVAAEKLFAATLAGAVAAEAGTPMELDELEIDFAWIPLFEADGTPWADTQEVKTQPFTTHVRYVRRSATLSAE